MWKRFNDLKDKTLALRIFSQGMFGRGKTEDFRFPQNWLFFEVNGRLHPNKNPIPVESDIIPFEECIPKMDRYAEMEYELYYDHRPLQYTRTRLTVQMQKSQVGHYESPYDQIEAWSWPVNLFGWWLTFIPPERRPLGTVLAERL